MCISRDPSPCNALQKQFCHLLVNSTKLGVEEVPFHHNANRTGPHHSALTCSFAQKGHGLALL